MEEREETTLTPMKEVPQMDNNPRTSASVLSESCLICGKTEKSIKDGYNKKRKREPLSKFRRKETFDQLMERVRKMGRDDILATVDGQDSTAFRYHRSCFRKCYFWLVAKSKPVRTDVSKLKMECFDEMMGTVINPRLVDLREVWSLKDLNRIFNKLYSEKLGYKVSKVSFVKDHIEQHYPDVRRVGRIGCADVMYFPSGNDDQPQTSSVNVVLSESDTDSDSDTEPDNSDVTEVNCLRSRRTSAEHKARSATRDKSSDASDSEEWRPGRDDLDHWSTTRPRHSQSNISKAWHFNLTCFFSPDCEKPGLVFPMTDKRWATLLWYCEEWKETEAPDRNLVLNPEDRKTKGYHDFCYLKFASKVRLVGAKQRYARKMGTYQKVEKLGNPELLPRLRSRRLPSSMAEEAVQRKRSSPASHTQSCPVPKRPKLNDDDDDGVLDTETSSQQEGHVISEKLDDVGSFSENETEKETTVPHSNASWVNENSEKTVKHKRAGKGRTGGRTVRETGQTVDRDTGAQANGDEARESDRDKSVKNKSTQPQLPCAFSDYDICRKSSAQVFPFTEIRWRRTLRCSAEWRAAGEPEGKIILRPEDREKKGYHNSCYQHFTAKTRLPTAKLQYSRRKHRPLKRNGVIKKETEVETSQSHSSRYPLITTTEAVEQGQSSEDCEPLIPQKAREEKQCTCDCYVKLVKLETETQ